MCHNGIAPVYNTGVVPSLVEHTHIQSKYICHINGTAHPPFVRADYHHVVGIDGEVWNMF